jgi:hypothetical protein
MLQWDSPAGASVISEVDGARVVGGTAVADCSSASDFLRE